MASNKAFCETTTPYVPDTIIKSNLLAIQYFFSQGGKLMREYFPGIAIERGRTYYTVLMAISSETGCVMSYIASQYHFGEKTINAAILALEAKGFIEPVNKPRLIIPFQAYKIDKGWSITPAGTVVLRRLVERLREGIK